MTRPRKPVALVTGGRRGIGLGIAQALAAAGFDIAIVDIAEPGPPADASPIGQLRSHGIEPLYLHADLADVEGHRATVEQALAHFGRLDCLVNNAGMSSVLRGDFLDLAPANFDAVMSTNLRGTVFFTQAVARAMLGEEAQGPRSIINITSVSAALSSPERLDYCISKAGLASFTQGLALRLAGHGIAVFEVRPGIIRTDMTAGVAAKYDTLIDGGLVPMRRWGEAADVGAICASLATGAFAFATGSVINADGGLSLGSL
jgi:3-oxoacyl-[acyl-carrier protein] reductase